MDAIKAVFDAMSQRLDEKSKLTSEERFKDLVNSGLVDENGQLMTRGSRYHLSQLDAIDWLRSLDNESVDLIITDPAYESLEKHRKVGTKTRLKHSGGSSNDWFQIFPNTRFRDLFTECYRVLKKDRHFYLMCDQETAFIIKPSGEECGFKFWKPLIWDKKKIGMGYHYRCRYEFILFFEKGKRKLNDLGIADVLEFPRVLNGYPTEKPVPLMEVLVKQSTQEGEVVIDPFMGSGSVGVASTGLSRLFWGNDISDRSIEIAVERLKMKGKLDEK